MPIRRADRLFDILRILRSAKAPVTAASIADELEVTVRTVYRLKPRWIVLENVIQMRWCHGYDPLIEEIRDLRYHVRPQVLDAADFGVPQTRRRVVGDVRSRDYPRTYKSARQKLESGPRDS